MRNVLLFVKNEPAKLKKVKPYEQSIIYVYPQSNAKSIPIKIIFVMFNGHKCGAILLAADRVVSRLEILSAYEQLISKQE
jgi:hypothetical protein